MRPFYDHAGVTLWHGDCRNVLAEMPRQSVRMCVTSPPYFGLRDYGIDGQIGLEATPDTYVAQLVAVFAAVREVLTDDGTLWLNLGDAYCGNGKGAQGATSQRRGRSNVAEQQRASEIGRTRITGLADKQLLGIPWRVVFALQADGWYLRSDIVWAKPNPMPESVRDRPTRSHEFIFLLAKQPRYFYDADAIAEPAVSVHGSGNGYDRPESLSRGGPGQTQGWQPSGRRYPSWAERKAAGEPSRQGDPAASGYANHGEGMAPRDGQRNKRDVWTVGSDPYPEAHFATFPPALITPCILAGSVPGDTVLDPFAGSGTALMVAKRLGLRAVGVELNAAYCDMATRRLSQEVLSLEVPA